MGRVRDSFAIVPTAEPAAMAGAVSAQQATLTPWSRSTADAATRIREPFHRPGWIYEEGGRLADRCPKGRRPRPAGEPQRRRPRAAVPEVAPAVAKLSARTLITDGESPSVMPSYVLVSSSCASQIRAS